jgi:hypothetical protein
MVYWTNGGAGLHFDSWKHQAVRQSGPRRADDQEDDEQSDQENEGGKGGQDGEGGEEGESGNEAARDRAKGARMPCGNGLLHI